MNELYLNSGMMVLGFVTLIWVVSLIKRDAGIMDIFWGLGFILVAGYLYLANDAASLLATLTLALTTLWGVRLAAHIAVRNWGQPEDARYRKWREENGRSWWWNSFLKVFLLQGTVMWVVSLPLHAALTRNVTPGFELLPWIGSAVFAAGFLFETIADWQLLRFKRNPANKGKVLDRGLWALSRHPNYFGESLVWWGLGVIGASTGAWWVLVSPVIMNFLLVRVSGVKMLDELLSRTNPGYTDYMKQTPAFLPLGRKAA